MASLSLAVLMACGLTLVALEEAEVSAQTPQKPNIVFILADDMRYDDFSYMPKTRALIGSQGATFSRAYVPLGICCPSRASILTGMYTHNHKVWFNENGANGGWQGFKSQGHERDNLATRLRGAGYRTGLFGKYLNDYDGSSVPRGWDDWFGKYEGYYYNWGANDNGTKVHYGRAEDYYSTDVIAGEARHFVGASVSAGKPFFAYVSPVAPHEPSTPAARDLREFDGEQGPRLPSFNEADVSDKPSFVRARSRLSGRAVAAIDNLHENRVESLQALDDLVESLIGELADQGVLDNPYVVFTSDNGWHHGEHRIPDRKHKVYEESIHVPLAIRGPSLSAGTTTDKLALNTDFFYPTFADLGDATASSKVDGRSLLPVLEGTATSWRSAVLLEKRHKTREGQSFFGILTREPKKYAEYRNGERELYDLGKDPHELSNTYSGRPPADLKARLEDLRRCAGATCRSAEGG
ncbi:MAG: sulfatase [Actinomycetota bacterium]|nr:sulfatase [Actinomycetota bacterium]